MKNIFVGNLDFNTREEELRQLFEAYGQVDRVSIMTDRDTGRSRGFGFVEMANATKKARKPSPPSTAPQSADARSTSTKRAPKPIAAAGAEEEAAASRRARGSGGGGGRRDRW